MTPALLEKLQREMKDDPYVFGARPAPPSPKNYRVSSAPGAAPPTFSHPATRKVPVLSQDGGTCVGNSIATCLMYLEYAETQKIVAFDGEALNARVTHKEGEPTWANLVMDAAIAQGVPSPGRSGLYFPKAYAKVDPRDTEAIKTAMSTPGNMLSGAFYYYGSDVMKDHNGLGEWPNEYYDPTPTNNCGYHEMTFVEYDSRGVRIQNTWDTWWGDKGFALLSWHYVNEHCTDIYVITDNANNAGGFIKTAQPNNVERVVRHPINHAVWYVKRGGRIWIRNKTEAARMAVDLTKVQLADLTDRVWLVPTVGPLPPGETL